MPATERSSPVDKSKLSKIKPKLKRERPDSAGACHNDVKTPEPPVEPVTFVTEIQQMMYGFGDCSQPLFESAQIIEEIVHQQLNSMLLQASDVSNHRGSKFIGPEDILFLFRKDTAKLSRLLRYMEMKDHKSVLGKCSEDNEEGEVAGAAEVKDTGIRVNKRRNVCHEFLTSLDQTGELVAILDNSDIFDDIKQARELRAEQMSRCLDQAQYIEYSESRRASFSRRFRPAKFRDWILRDNNLVELKPSGIALELCHYVAYETVAQIVDLALLVKSESSRSGDPVSRTMPPLAMNPNFPSVYLSTCPAKSGQNPAASPLSGSNTPPQGSMSPSSPTGGASSSSLHSPTGKTRSKKRIKSQGDVKSSLNPGFGRILPCEIREALHRYLQQDGPFQLFSQKRNPNAMGSKLLCC